MAEALSLVSTSDGVAASPLRLKVIVLAPQRPTPSTIPPISPQTPSSSNSAPQEHKTERQENVPRSPFQSQGHQGDPQASLHQLLASMMTPETIERFKSFITPENIELARRSFEQHFQNTQQNSQFPFDELLRETGFTVAEPQPTRAPLHLSSGLMFSNPLISPRRERTKERGAEEPRARGRGQGHEDALRDGLRQ